MNPFQLLSFPSARYCRCPQAILLALGLGLSACGGGSGSGADTLAGGASAPGEPTSIDSPAGRQLVGALAFQMVLQPSPLLAAPLFSDLVFERGRQAVRIADGDDGILRPASMTWSDSHTAPSMARPRTVRLVDCPGGGRVRSQDIPGLLFFDFDACTVAGFDGSSTYLNGQGEIDGNRIRLDMEIRMGGQRMQYRVRDLVVEDRGRACDARVSMAEGSLSSDGSGGAFMAAWTNVTSDWRPAGSVCTWNVDGRFASNGRTLLDSGDALPAIRHDVIIRSLEPLRYDSRRRDDLNFPFAGTVLIQPQPSGAQVQVRFTDGGAYFQFPEGDETFVSQADMLERVRSAD